MRLELTRRGDYAVRAMLALADEDGERWLSVRLISTRMTIPQRFLPHVMTDLVRAGLIEGRQGRTGGYRLTRPPAGISLLDVIRAAEPDDLDPACILRGGPCGEDGRCAVHDVFAGARAALVERLGATTLADATGSMARRDQGRVRPVAKTA